MRVLIAPCYEGVSQERVHTVLNEIDEIYGIDMIIVDQSRGVCFSALMWPGVKENETMTIGTRDTEFETYHAMFELGKPDLVVVFDANSTATQSVVRIANSRKVRVIGT